MRGMSVSTPYCKCEYIAQKEVIFVYLNASVCLTGIFSK